MTIRSLLTVMLLTTTTISYAHRGGMDSNGGHNNRKTGEYHCHRDNCIERNGAKKITAQSGYKSGKYERKSCHGDSDTLLFCDYCDLRYYPFLLDVQS